MIDSVLKGTGNSRFLKSAVPAGTSWADALAMLQAGTFPIDFNGINAEGFQQVGTPLNKANLLKDATAAQIGLPPSTTPDGMFRALGNTGELHVWRKTVTTAQEIPAGYKLESAKETLISTRAEYGSGTQRIIVEYASSCSVSESGDPYLVNSSSAILEATSSTAITSLNNLKGKFLKFSKDSSYQYVTVADGIFFIPSDATFRLEGGPYRIFVDKAQKVTGYAKIPAGTTTTYPVSTNPNAYQEGDDAKEAGYTLGDVEQNKEMLRDTYGDVLFYVNYSNSLSVSDDGTVTLKNPAGSGNYAIGGTKEEFSSYCNSNLRGKFCKFYIASGNHGTIVDGIYFIPADAMFSHGSASAPYTIISSKVQPVTGYAAIPAGTTIEYLGKLGDKARVQVVSYVGTGTYGRSNPNSLTFDFAPKVVIVNGHRVAASYTISYSIILSPQSGGGVSMLGNDRGYVYWVICEAIDRTVSWYADSYGNQLNESGMKYVAVAIG